MRRTRIMSELETVRKEKRKTHMKYIEYIWSFLTHKINLLSLIFAKPISQSHFEAIWQNLLDDWIYSCLYQYTGYNPICQSSNSRVDLFSLSFRLSNQNLQNVDIIPMGKRSNRHRRMFQIVPADYILELLISLTPHFPY